jgi:hypothetical protein
MARFQERRYTTLPRQLRGPGGTQYEYRKLQRDGRAVWVRDNADISAALDSLHWLEHSPRVLFVGPLGTGKTMAAQIVAAALGRPIFEIELRQMLSLSEQEAEAAVGRVFVSGDASQAVLLFNGAELLAARRAHADRREGVGSELAQTPWSEEVGSEDKEAVAALDRRLSHVIEATRAHDALVVFAGAPTQVVEELLAKRFDVVVNFPFPDREMRKEIWRRALPSNARLTENGLDYLATWMRWPGSTIHSCCEAAAFEAAEEGVPMQLHHVAAMLERGYRSRVSPGYTGTSDGPPLPDVAPAPPVDSEISKTRVPVARFAGQIGTRSVIGGALVAGVLGAGVLGAIVANATTRPSSATQSTRSIRAGLVQISYPSNWRAKSPSPTSGIRLADQLTLGSARGLLLVGRTTPGNASALPQSLIARLVPAAAAQIVKIRNVSLYRYVSPSRPDSRAVEWVYAAPTTVGTIVGVCKPDRAPAPFISDCEQVLGTIRLTSGRFLPLDLTSSYPKTVSAAISKLNAVRSSTGAELARATNAREQAVAEKTLATAHASAAAELLRVNAGSASGANTEVVNALDTSAKAYTALALATAGHDREAYASARASVVRADEQLNAAFAQLKQLGYRVT